MQRGRPRRPWSIGSGLALAALVGLVGLVGEAAVGGRAAERAGGTAARSAQALEPQAFLPAALRVGALHGGAPTAPATARATPSPPASPTAQPGSPTATGSPAPSPTPGCGTIPALDAGLEPDRIVHVATDGNDEGGDGSAARPFRTIGRAAREAGPGVALRIHAGTYAGGVALEDVGGAPGAPLWIGGAPGEARPVLEGGTEGLHLTRPRHLVVHDLEIRGSAANGLNADDGGARAAEVAHDLVFRDLHIHDIGGDGNQDCLKLSGLRRVLVEGGAFARCGGGGAGSGVDMVGVHQALVARADFREISGNALQVKGGSRDVELRWSRLRDAGARAVNMGGSTGFAYFRPPLLPGEESAEARDVRVLANLIEGSDTPFAFVGCVDCLAAHNTVLRPRRWLLRILQETTSRDGYVFAPARDGRVVNNLFVFRRDELRSDVNVGPDTAPETFAFRHNLFYAEDAPGASAPTLPGSASGSVLGLDPALGEEGRPAADSPALAAGLPGGWVQGDRDGRCWADPPAIGAYAAP